MNTRCKPNDLAMVVKSNCKAEGKITTCLKLHPAGFDGWGLEEGVIWEVNPPIPAMLVIRGVKTKTIFATEKDVSHTFPDRGLCPIRGGMSDEETYIDIPKGIQTKKEPTPCHSI